MFLASILGKAVAQLLCAFAFLAIAGASSFACSCIGPANAQEGLARAKSVFVGTVVSANEDNFSFGVERVWKGATGRRIVVRDYYAGTSCALNFKVGVRYVVFAKAFDDEGKTILIGDVCNWTSRFPEARAVIKQIGPGNRVRLQKRRR